MTDSPLSVPNLTAIVEASRARVQALEESPLKEAYKDLCRAASTCIGIQRMDGLLKSLDEGMPTGDPRIDEAYEEEPRGEPYD